MDLDTLSRASRPKVFRLAYSLTKNRQDAEDLTQEALLRAYRSFGKWDGRSFDNWVLRIAQRLFLDFMRHRGRRIQACSVDEPRFGDTEDLAFDPADSHTPESILMGDTISEEILNALSTLRPAEQRCIEFSAQGLDYAEICQRTGSPEGTCRSDLHRSRRKLQKILR